MARVTLHLLLINMSFFILIFVGHKLFNTFLRILYEELLQQVFLPAHAITITHVGPTLM